MKKIETNNLYYRHGRFAIPADCPAALDFYFQRLLVPHARREMLLAPIARRSSALGRLLFKSTPEKSGFDGAKAGVAPGSLAQVLSARLKNSGIEMSGEDVRLLLLGDYVHSGRGQSVAFIFDDAAETPLAVAKIGGAAHREALEKEFETLQNLSRSLPPGLLPGIPKPFELFAEAGFTVLLESALAGASVHFEMRNDWSPRRLAEKHFSAAFTWLRDFHRATFKRKIRFENLREGSFAGCFEKLRRVCGTSKAEDNFIAEMMTAASRFDNEEIPLSFVQGDFWTRNILLDGAKIGVVDWEHARAEGCSLDDAFMFAISYGRSYQWRFGGWLAPREAFARTFYGDSEFSETVGAQLKKFCRELAINEKLLGVFLAGFLARQALAEASKQDRSPNSDSEKASELSTQEEVTPWRNLFREYAGAAKKHVCFG